MNTNDQRAEARSRANRRLRRMTIVTAILGVAATGGLGWASALTYNGALTQSALTAAVTTETVDGATPATSGTSSSTSTAAATAAPTVASTTGQAHVSTGGS